MPLNPYAATPLCVAQADPTTGKHVRAFFFLGSVPKNVLAAAQRGKAQGNDPRVPQWNTSDKATLRRFYGAQWKEILTPKDPPAPETLATATNVRNRHQLRFFTGGEEDNTPIFDEDTPIFDEDTPIFDDDLTQFETRAQKTPSMQETKIDFGDLTEIDRVDDKQDDQMDISTISNGLAWGELSAMAPVYTDIAVYPEDTIYDLRLKLHLASGVPLYRQHLFFYVNEEGPTVPYRITVDSAPIVVDWRALTRGKALGDDTLVAGLTIDSRLEERREGIHIEALDTFTNLSTAPNIRVTRAYFVDLFTVIPPLGAPERPQDNLSSVLRDRYQFDLLYYGALLRFWPQLSPDACTLALSDPTKIAAAYPTLEPSTRALKFRFDAEQPIADRALQWRPSASKGARQTTAVTSATMRVSPNSAKMRAAIRNIFDWIPTSISIAAITARFEVDSTLLTDAGAAVVGPNARQGGQIPVSAQKRHATSYAPRSATAINWFTTRLPKRNTVSFALARGDSDGEWTGVAGLQVHYVYLTVLADGSYEATADWREDDRVGFDTVTTEVSAVVTPTINAINKMGAAAFPIGGELRAGSGTKAAATLGAITVSAFWPHALTAIGFREAKRRFRLYEKAGIVGIRGLQQAGAYTFSFRKGVVAYDSRLASSLRAGDGVSAQNQYSWMTDSAAAARWATIFQGRIVRIHHRATDLRVEIVGADSLGEFELIRRYIFSFLDKLIVGPNRIRVGDTAEPTRRREDNKVPTATRRLRRLQERDPNLFDLKKYDQGATVYSVLCQSGRQPHVYSATEVSSLAAKRRGKLVRYWNFTENTPAFYECPDPKYPHLSFRAGQHPMGYCLPCCKKTRPATGSRAALVNESCLQQRTYDRSTTEDSSMSRHVLTYGKAVSVGRVAEVPREVRDGLFLGALPKPYQLYIIGVEQTAPAVPDAGFAYALASAIGVGETSIDEVLSELAALAREMGDTFYALGDGGGASFSSAQELADTIISTFVRRDDALSSFGPGGAASTSWPGILVELARHVYGVEVVVLSDESGTGSVMLEASPDAVTALLSGGYTPPRVAILITGPMGTYPIAAINPRFYLRIPPPYRWMASRRTFDFNDPPSEFADVEEFVTDRVAEIVRETLASVATNKPPTIDLGIITRYARSPDATFSVDERLINLQNLCYGVIVSAKSGGGQAYIAVRFSAYPVDGTRVRFGPRPDVKLPAAILNDAVVDINKFIKTSSEPFAPIERVATLVDASGNTAVGFATGSKGASRLYYYHDPVAYDAKGEVIRFPYDSRTIDVAIVEAVRGQSQEPLDADAEKLRAAANSRNRLYRLFLAEFATALRSDRNDKLRARIIAAINATRFKQVKSVSSLRRKLAEMLQEFPEDLQIVREAISRAYVNSPQNTAKAAIKTIVATEFAFDRQTLARLRLLPSHGDVVAELRKLLGKRVVGVSGEGAIPPSRNMYVSCSGMSSDEAQCKGQRLMVPEARLNDFYDILAADVLNPGKTNLLAAVSAGVFDPLDFIRRPGENLGITLGI